ncbi:xanthine dehydrogenase family protein molybdopterin-binding subunit [Salinimonas sp. HHU 13199]|uniref:Xanthine dehydrogenase family protein molybdopterin-binding subunit n=1 Tax=Salinimonas profundi TaxID=2729140 RepID=A0ABR8LH23_9ALTE|nr:molybdopterin cofactor-binding domain-containing protein [Salinimonas profundi]MBD3584391.1 xanthine dehydrogenase family protein molybdopterin-binding subunit [Salinimonas profundi]
MNSVENQSRRHFLAGSSLVIGFALAPKAMALSGKTSLAQGAKTDQKQLNAFVIVSPDNTVTVLSKHLEMGQGPYTGLTQLVAEELDADWSQMRATASPADDTIYANNVFGMQGTGGSTAIANSYEQFRRAGATAKAMLVAAAAARWQVPTNSLKVVGGIVSDPASNRQATYGELAEDAAMLTPPTDVKLKDPADFTIIGAKKTRLDTPDKTDGKALFTLDHYPDNVLVAVVARAPYFNASVKRVDDKKARKIKGVVDIKPVSQGVAVFAEDTWSALQAKATLDIEWDTSNAEQRSSDEIIADYREQMKKTGFEATKRGDVAGLAARDDLEVIEAEFIFPYLAHAPMETLDAVLQKNEDGSITCFNGAQFPGQDKQAISEITGVPAENVHMEIQLAGGSFGRRAQFGSPYMREAAEVFKASGMQRPVKHLHTREDDIQGGFYRPLFIHKIKGYLDSNGEIVGWDQVIAGQPLMKKDELDETSVEGASDLPYKIENLNVFSHNTTAKVPVLWWRSVGHTHTGFVVEAFLDELLQKAGKDPIDGRLALLPKESREAGVLKAVAKLIKDKPLAQGRQRGIAVHKSFSTYVAEVADVSVGEDGCPRVHNVYVAVDCGVAVNPDTIRAQMEGGVGFGLGAILFDEIELDEGGKVRQSNFHDYRSLRINEMPHVEVDVVMSGESPTGVGEPGVPPIGPAVANAWRRLTGKPVRRLPINRYEKA